MNLKHMFTHNHGTIHNKMTTFCLIQIRFGMKSIVFEIFFVGCAVSYLKEPRPDEGAEEEDKYLHALDILRKYGYPAENHEVITEDGYILSIHRIPYGRMCPPENVKGPVLLQHGLFCSSMEFITTGTKRGLAYVLADSCYDVWIPNSRGNKYSKAHVRLDTRSQAYWNFSWHEMGIYDLPASVDYILNKTNSKDLLFVGHSQGGTSFFIFASLRPEYTNKVKAGFMLAPIAYMGHAKSEFLKTISRFQNVLSWAAKNFGLNQFLAPNKFLSEVGGQLCKKNRPTSPAICENVMFIIAGFDSEQINNTVLPIVLWHTPAGASTKQVLHYAQGLNKGNFAYFDYGTVKNMKIYNQKEPPNYDLKKIKIPTIIFYSSNDWLADPEDIDILYDQLSCYKKKILIPYKKFNHVDFLYAKDVVTMLYDSVVENMDKFVLTKDEMT